MAQHGAEDIKVSPTAIAFNELAEETDRSLYNWASAMTDMPGWHVSKEDGYIISQAGRKRGAREASWRMQCQWKVLKCREELAERRQTRKQHKSTKVRKAW